MRGELVFVCCAWFGFRQASCTFSLTLSIRADSNSAANATAAMESTRRAARSSRIVRCRGLWLVVGMRSSFVVGRV
jgi:hypothetical protein